LFISLPLYIKSGVLCCLLKFCANIISDEDFGGKAGCTHMPELTYFVINLLVGSCVVVKFSTVLMM
jgi:hypothetical protein